MNPSSCVWEDVVTPDKAVPSSSMEPVLLSEPLSSDASVLVADFGYAFERALLRSLMVSVSHTTGLQLAITTITTSE